MNSVKVGNTEYMMNATGLSAVIFTDEFHQDIFRACQFFTFAVNKGVHPDIDITSKLMYTFIKNANEGVVKDYRTFMSNLKGIRCFYEVSNLNAILKEINELLETGEELPAENGKKKTKKTAANN